MSTDPIVDEVRKAGERLASEAGNDLHRFFEKLRQAQEGYGKSLVREPVAHYGVRSNSEGETETTHK